MKEFLRRILLALRLDLTKNLYYDRLSLSLMKKVLRPDSNCIDVGCHKGEILQRMLKLSPNGKHIAFEPLPNFYGQLLENFSAKAEIFPYALGEEVGKSKFQYVKNAPAFSGLRRRKYLVKEADIEEIEVEVRRLDDIVKEDVRIDFIKIDVEGGELAVMKGGIKTIRRCKPFILFETGLGASEYYGTGPEDIFDFLDKEAGLKLSTLSAYISDGQNLSREEFCGHFRKGSEYYFLAHS